MALKLSVYFILIVIIDQVTKHYCVGVLQGVSFGPFSFSEIHNKGFILGSFSDLPPALRVVSISTLYGFIFLLFLLSQYLLVAKLSTLRIGAALLMGGISGNTIDRAVYGSVIDFVSILPQTYFNLADVFQLLGFSLLVYSLFRNQEEIWHPNCLRKNYVVNGKLQMRFALKFTAIGFALSFIIGVFTLSFLTLLSIERSHVTAFVISYVVITLVYLIITFIAGFIISHKYLGPLYAFELFIEDIVQGKNREFRLRKGDQYKHLEDVAEKIRTKFFQG
jgi:signal peptidase II